MTKHEAQTDHRKQVVQTSTNSIISCPEAIEYEVKTLPQHHQPQKDPENGRFVSGPSVELPPTEQMVRTERSLKIAIADWVSFWLLGWKLPNGNIPSTPIWLDWTHEEELRPWTQLELEVDCSTFSGNYSELAFSYPFKYLKRLYLEDKPFLIPPRQFTTCPQYLFSLHRLPGTISYLQGCFYTRELPEDDLLDSLSHDPFERRKHKLRCMLILEDLASAPNALIRVTDSSGRLEQALSEHHPAVNKILNRRDVMRYHSVTERHDDRLETELYLELDLKQSRTLGYLCQKRTHEKASS